MASMNLFLDSNVWLSFYHYTADDLEQLHKLQVLISRKRVTLFICDQVRAEVRRNREAKIASAVTQFRGEKLSAEVPRMCQDYPEYATLKEAARQYQHEKAQLLKRMESDAKDGKLGADLVIAKLFASGKRVSPSSANIDAARLRVDLGNPPGKNRSLGDAVNWECLLAAVPDGENLIFITNDSDYLSRLNDSDFSPVLLNEWSETKGSEIVFFARLSSFFGSYFPDIKFAADLERDLSVSDLQESFSFASTRSALRRLAPMAKELTVSQVDAIVDATLSNNQIYWIAGDADINQLIRQVVRYRSRDIDDTKLAKLNELLSDPPAT